MLIDTHCHINTIVKNNFDIPLHKNEIQNALSIIDEAQQNDVSIIINVGTSVVESNNCIELAHNFKNLFATVGIHPNDCSAEWKKDFETIKKLTRNKQTNKIVGIGECGLDRHYPDYQLQRQIDAFKAHIELALENDLALVIHSRDAYDETLKIVEEYKNDITRAVMHCFSYDDQFALTVTSWNFVLGIGGTITYPKNEILRSIVKDIDLKKIVLETDAPFLPPQIMHQIND